MDHYILLTCWSLRVLIVSRLLLTEPNHAGFSIGLWLKEDFKWFKYTVVVTVTHKHCLHGWPVCTQDIIWFFQFPAPPNIIVAMGNQAIIWNRAHLADFVCLETNSWVTTFDTDSDRQTPECWHHQIPTLSLLGPLKLLDLAVRLPKIERSNVSTRVFRGYFCFSWLFTQRRELQAVSDNSKSKGLHD